MTTVERFIKSKTVKVSSTQTGTFASTKRATFPSFSTALAQEFFFLGCTVGAGMASFNRKPSEASPEAHNTELINEPRCISVNQAKNEIAEYFKAHDGENVDYVDIMDALNIHLPLIVDACAKLEKEGKIAAVD